MPQPKKKGPGREPDIHDLLKLHIDAWGRLAELIDVCTKQRDAGHLKVARRTFVQIERLLDEVTALEAMVKPTDRG
jgi:hypothetical protein